jgi:hypothetical protein
MKHITSNELNTGLYEMLDNTDPLVCQKSNYYTSYPDPLDPKWDIITYYRLVNDQVPTYVRKSVDGVSVRWDNKPDNSWFEDLKNLDI